MSTNHGLFKSQSSVDVAFAAGWLAAGAVLWFAALSPALRDNEVRLQQEAQLSTMRVEKEAAELRAKAERTQLAKTEKQLAALDVTLSDVGALNQRLADMTRLCEEVATATGGQLKIEQLTPGAPTPVARFTSVPIKLAGTAQYGAAAELLSRIHAQFRDTGVSGFTLAQESEAPGALSRFQLELVWYAAPASAGTGGGSKAGRASGAEGAGRDGPAGGNGPAGAGATGGA